MKDRMEVWEVEGLPAGECEMLDARRGVDGTLFVTLRGIDDGRVATLEMENCWRFMHAASGKAWKRRRAELAGEYGRDFVDGNTVFKIRDSSLVEALCAEFTEWFDPSEFVHARLVMANCAMDLVLYPDAVPIARAEPADAAGAPPCEGALGDAPSALSRSHIESGLPSEVGCDMGCAGFSVKGTPGGLGGGDGERLFRRRTWNSGENRLSAWAEAPEEIRGERANLYYDECDVEYGRDGCFRAYLSGLQDDPVFCLAVEGDVLLFREVEEYFWFSDGRDIARACESGAMSRGFVSQVNESSLARELEWESCGDISASGLTHLMYESIDMMMEVVFCGKARLEPAPGRAPCALPTA